MVDQTMRLDAIFGALSNQYRRDILRRASLQEQTSAKLAEIYGLTVAAVVKHFGVLESAGLIRTEKRGKERFARLAPETVREAAQHLAYYEKFWTGALDRLEAHLESSP